MNESSKRMIEIGLTRSIDSIRTALQSPTDRDLTTS